MKVYELKSAYRCEIMLSIYLKCQSDSKSPSSIWNSHPPTHSLFFSTHEPFTFVPVTQLCSYVYLCVLQICVFPRVPRNVNACLFDTSFPPSAALKARVCLFSAKPRRERCVGAHRLASWGTTPHRNVWNYTQQGLAHPCLLSLALPVCHSFAAWA